MKFYKCRRVVEPAKTTTATSGGRKKGHFTKDICKVKGHISASTGSILKIDCPHFPKISPAVLKVDTRERERERERERQTERETDRESKRERDKVYSNNTLC